VFVLTPRFSPVVRTGRQHRLGILRWTDAGPAPDSPVCGTKA
jgi:hypothetical protein